MSKFFYTRRGLVWLKIESSDAFLSTEQQTSKLPDLRFLQQFCCKIKFSGRLCWFTG